MNEFELLDGVWHHNISEIDGNGDEGIVVYAIPITDVPVGVLLQEWESLVHELSCKEVKLGKLKELYNGKEFDIVYQSDIDFKALYGSTAEKVRKQHASDVLSELNDEINGLELSIAWIKSYVPLLREVIKWKESNRLPMNNNPIIFHGGSTFDEESIEQLKKALKEIKNE